MVVDVVIEYSEWQQPSLFCSGPRSRPRRSINAMHELQGPVKSKFARCFIFNLIKKKKSVSNLSN